MIKKLLISFVICSVFPAFGNTKSISTDKNLSLPPVPENRTISRQLEVGFLGTSGSLGCSTDEEKDINSRPPQIQNGVINPRYRWNSFNVYPDPAYNDQERTLINNAVDRLRQAVPCLNFGIYPRGATPSGDYVHIKKGAGCWSFVGRLGGAQDMSLQSPGCMAVHVIVHELIHALGFYHEQSRSDRDDFVTIMWQNILPGREHNFNKYGSNVVSGFGVAYNQRSIMHYKGYDFSANGRPTIVAKNGGAVGSTGDLQQTDIEKLRKMYNC